MSGVVVDAATMFEEKVEGDMAEMVCALGRVGSDGHRKDHLFMPPFAHAPSACPARPSART